MPGVRLHLRRGEALEAGQVSRVPKHLAVRAANQRRALALTGIIRLTLVWTNEELLIDGDRVAEMTTLSGTDTGGFMGRPPTGKPFRVPIVWLFTVKDGQFTRARPIYDFTGLLVQIGLLKAKPA